MPPSNSQLAFVAPGVVPPAALPGDMVVPLVEDGREVELSLHPLVAELRESLPELYHTARTLAQTIGHSLPRSLAPSPDSLTPRFWDCYQDEFARFSIAPVLINHQIARNALAERGCKQVRVIERPSGSWWVGRSVAEAVVAAGRELGTPVQITPRAVWRGLRRVLLPAVAWLRPLGEASRSYSPSGPGLRVESRVAQPCEVLFLAVGATSAPLIARLAASLEAEYGLHCAAADLHFGGSTKALNRVTIPIVDAHPSLYGRSEIRAAAWRWLRWWRHFKANYTPDEAYGWLGPVVLRRMLLALARDAGWVQAQLAAARAVLDSVAPRVVVGFHRYATIIPPLVLTAQRRGLATIYCQHGIRGPYYRTLGSLPWDKMLMFGRYSVELFSDLVCPHTEFALTGHCLYDEVSTSLELGAARQTREKFVGSHNYLVVVPTQTDEYLIKASARQWWLRGVAEVGHSVDAAVVLKIHPEESHPDIYEELVRHWPDTVTVVPHGQGNLSELIAAADLLVTRDSTVTYEANLRGKPVVTVNLSGQRDRYPLAEHGGAAGVYRYEDIQPTVQELLTDEAARTGLAATRRDFLEYHLGPSDGRATARITAIIAAAAQS